MIYILSAIIAGCLLIGITDLIVKLWDRLDPPAAEITEIHNRKDNAA